MACIIRPCARDLWVWACSRRVFSIQTAGLAKRLEHVGVKRVVLGVSGGLDSTLALLVCLRTFELLGLDRGGIRAISMPAFGTSATTQDSAARASRHRPR